MKRLSKKRLFETLAARATTTDAFAHFKNVNEKAQRLNHRMVSNETYGKNSRVYLSFPNEDAKLAAVPLLLKAGFDVNNGWTRGNKRAIDVPVTYFQGDRYWE